MNKKFHFLHLIIASCFGAFIALFSFNLFFKKTNEVITKKQSSFEKYLKNGKFTVPKGLNFVHAAEKVSPCVVHIKTVSRHRRADFHGETKDFYQKHPNIEELDDYYNFQRPQTTGSGVIISKDGYIITNNHVIENAKTLIVTLFDKQTYQAEIIGIDPATDLALIKIDAKNLTSIDYGNSDTIAIGEWVLAIGNPFNLNTTVTAGIVSAKARGLGLIKDYRNGSNYAIESFIQTDAAVNPGNSGGALVDLKGKLIGINTAIATNSGSYEGYSFAVPTSIVKKVIKDLKTYGRVQRAMLGVAIAALNTSTAKALSLNNLNGVRITFVADKGAAKQAGLKTNDVILKINDKDIEDVAQLQGTIATFRPGDKIQITYFRKGKIMKTIARLRNKLGKLNILRKTSLSYQSKNKLGAEFMKVSETQRDYLGIDNGIKVSRLYDGKLKQRGIREGFIITSIDDEKTNSIRQINELFFNKKGTMLIEGFYPNGEKGYYTVVIN